MIDDGRPSTVVPFPSRPVRNCISEGGCGSHFRPLSPSDLLCPTCMYWRRALMHLSEAGRAFDRLRELGHL
jgi:hypothetical protein